MAAGSTVCVCVKACTCLCLQVQELQEPHLMQDPANPATEHALARRPFARCMAFCVAPTGGYCDIVNGRLMLCRLTKPFPTLTLTATSSTSGTWTNTAQLSSGPGDVVSDTATVTVFKPTCGKPTAEATLPYSGCTGNTVYDPAKVDSSPPGPIVCCVSR